MDIEQLQTQDIQAIDTSTLFPDITSQITDILAPFLLISVVLSAALVIMYILSALRKRKVEKAILDIQATLHEMNEREKARTRPAPTPPKPQDSRKIIAAEPAEDTGNIDSVS